MNPNLKVSVIIPVYMARKWIEDCLLSLCGQTLKPSAYEIITVLNGPDDGSAALIRRISKSHPNHKIRVVSSSPAGASAARNEGIEIAEGQYLTFVDADDWVSPHYLELLYKNSSSGIIPVTQIVNVSSNCKYDFHNRYNELILGRQNPIVDPKEFFTPLSFIASKMIPTQWAKDTLFDESLRSTEDVVFNYDLYSKYDFKFSMFPAATGATYYRRTTLESVSRGHMSRNFLVDQRIQAMERIAQARSNAPAKKKRLFLEPLKAQLKLLATYLPKASQKEKQQIIDSVVAIGVTGLNWSALQEKASRLVIALNFVPYNDTGAIVTAKRIRDRGKTVDVISNSMSGLRETQFENKLICEPYISRHKSLTPAIRYFGSPKEVTTFIRKGLETYQSWKTEGRLYKELYSRSMWPHSHLLAAAIKRTDPELYWEAEFSDPNSLTVEGEKRVHPPVTNDILEYFANWGTAEEQKELINSPYIMRWAELLPYFFADSLIFTNGHQLETMLEHAPASYHDKILEKSVVSAHPTLPTSFYKIRPSLENSRQHISIAYFGDFYKTRGMAEIFSALDHMSDSELAAIRFSIFTSSKLEDVNAHIPDRVRSVVVLQPKLDYLSFLASLDSHDVLIVNDANTKDYFQRNPYLPSKVSDYLGSQTPIWAVVEPGSILSTMVFRYQSTLGDMHSALKVLRQVSRDYMRLQSASSSVEAQATK